MQYFAASNSTDFNSSKSIYIEPNLRTKELIVAPVKDLKHLS